MVAVFKSNHSCSSFSFGVVCPVARVIYTVLREICSVAAVHCVAEVSPKSVICALLDCPLAGMVVDHSLMSGITHSRAGIINHIAAHTQAMPCVLTIYAAV